MSRANETNIVFPPSAIFKSLVYIPPQFFNLNRQELNPHMHQQHAISFGMSGIRGKHSTCSDRMRATNLHQCKDGESLGYKHPVRMAGAGDGARAWRLAAQLVVAMASLSYAQLQSAQPSEHVENVDSRLP